MHIRMKTIWLWKTKSFLKLASKVEIFSVVPTGEVDSRIIKSSFFKKGAIFLQASSMKFVSGTFKPSLSFLNGVGTAIINVSAD